MASALRREGMALASPRRVQDGTPPEPGGASLVRLQTKVRPPPHSFWTHTRIHTPVLSINKCFLHTEEID